jgi:ribosomal 30S subunit maturation factor RimM
MIHDNEILKVGMLKQLRGQHKALCLIPSSDLLDTLIPRFLIASIDGINVPFEVLEFKPHGTQYLVTLDGVDTEQRLQQLHGKQVSVHRRELPDDYEEAPPVDELEGFMVCSTDGRQIGRIVSVDTQTANTLIELDDGAVLPLHEDLVVEVIPDERQLIMELPEGLIQ